MVLLRVEVNLAWPSLWISWYLNSVCQFLMIYSLCDYMFRIFLFVILAPPGEKKSNTGAIVGGVIGGILFLILVGAGVFFFLRWKSKYSVLVHSSRKVAWRSNTTFFFTVLRSIFENVTVSGSGTGFQNRCQSRHSSHWKYLQNFIWENTYSVIDENINYSYKLCW